MSTSRPVYFWITGAVGVTSVLGVAVYGYFTWRKHAAAEERSRRKKEKATRTVNIGGTLTVLTMIVYHVLSYDLSVGVHCLLAVIIAIFGMDVGGTLTKIVYFEKNVCEQVGVKDSTEVSTILLDNHLY